MKPVSRPRLPRSRASTSLAGVMARGDTVEELYRKMVDENLVRKDISFAEMAMLAMKYAADPATSENDPDKAVAVVFRPASYQKRSYIRSFIKVMDRLQEMLRFPQHIPRALGLALAARMDEIEGIPRAIKAELEGLSNRSVQDELAVLRRFSGEDLPDPGAKTFPAGKGGAGKSARQAKTTFQLSRPEGAAKCTASTGRLEIRLARDFSAVDRRKLEAAVQQLLDQIS